MNYEENVLDTFDTTGAEEKQRIVAALEIFKASNPEPIHEELLWSEAQYIEPTFRSEFGLEAAAMTVSVIGSVLVSSFTVGLMLFISAINTDVTLVNMAGIPPWLKGFMNASPILFFLAGMLAFEGYALSHGLARGKETGQVRFSPWALIASFSVMLSTGLLRSFALMSPDNTIALAMQGFVQWIVVISTGIGAPIIVFYGTENIGVFINKFKTAKITSRKAFEDSQKVELAEFKAEQERIYNEYLSMRTDWGKQFTKWYRINALSIFGVDRNTSAKRIPEEHNENDVSIQASVEKYLLEHDLSAHQVGIEAGDLIAPSAIARELKLDPARVRKSLSRIRQHSV